MVGTADEDSQKDVQENECAEKVTAADGVEAKAG
jgi:hypothetical protein